MENEINEKGNFMFGHLTISCVQMELQQSNFPQQRNELEEMYRRDIQVLNYKLAIWNL